MNYSIILGHFISKENPDLEINRRISFHLADYQKLNYNMQMEMDIKEKNNNHVKIYQITIKYCRLKE